MTSYKIYFYDETYTLISDVYHAILMDGNDNSHRSNVIVIGLFANEDGSKACFRLDKDYNSYSWATAETYKNLYRLTTKLHDDAVPYFISTLQRLIDGLQKIN